MLPRPLGSLRSGHNTRGQPELPRRTRLARNPVAVVGGLSLSIERPIITLDCEPLLVIGDAVRSPLRFGPLTRHMRLMPFHAFDVVNVQTANALLVERSQAAGIARERRKQFGEPCAVRPPRGLCRHRCERGILTTATARLRPHHQEVANRTRRPAGQTTRRRVDCHLNRAGGQRGRGDAWHRSRLTPRCRTDF